ncbi:MAG TPA: NCS1 family nucleobase:cation symporter-1 [Streptosporangiaceae bacterium]|nr:NCS1 family nucleobase:cation symporter-1 [Streptosporangiaceae bacterium]
MSEIAQRAEAAGSGGTAIPGGFSSELYNEDLAPSTTRDWGVYSLFCMWMSDVHSVGGYTFAAGLFFLGLNGWWVFFGLVLGTGVVMALMNLTGIAGQRLGVPYPVLARLSFGVRGANLPAIVRAIVGIAWYGIQTYLASVAIQVLVLKISPSAASWTHGGFLGLPPLGWIAFLAIWVLQLLLIRRGMETIRRFQDLAGPAIWIAMIALAVWVLVKSGGHLSMNFGGPKLSTAMSIKEFFVVISLVVSYFAALLLNFCDFSRFTPTKREVQRGNLLGLPVNFIAFAIVTTVVTAGSFKVYGQYITDPVELVSKISLVPVLILGAVTFAVATLGINVVANFVSAAYDLSNLVPRKLDFRRAGLVAAVLALVVMPWKLYSSPAVINDFLGTMGAFLGPLFGILMTDYYLFRRQRVAVAELYRAHGGYTYTGGVNWRALLSFVVAAAVAAPVALLGTFTSIAAFAWPIGVVIGGALYFFLMIGQPVIGEPPTTDPEVVTETVLS